MTEPHRLSLSQVYRPGPGWYRGDFHCHTDFSDGALAPAALADLARANGLDFIAITDHNTIAAYEHFGPAPPVLVIPGIEATFKQGHCNILGVTPGADWLAPLTAGSPRIPLTGRAGRVNDLLRATAGLGLLNSINHPLLRPWAWEFGEVDWQWVHALEIWNDPSWPENQVANPRAVDLWTALLNDGYRVTALGGSDYHRPAPRPSDPPKPAEVLGRPATLVYAAELSGAAILTAVRQQRVYVSAGPRVALEAEAGGQRHALGADLGAYAGPLTLSAAVAGSAEAGRARMVKNGRPLAEAALADGAARLEVTDELRGDAPAWYRCDVYGAGGQLLAITNPIFAGPRRPPQRMRFGDFVDLSDLEVE